MAMNIGIKAIIPKNPKPSYEKYPGKDREYNAAEKRIKESSNKNVRKFLLL